MPPALRFWPRHATFRSNRGLNSGSTRGPNIAGQPHRMNNPDALTDFLPEAEEPQQPLPPAGAGARGFQGRHAYPRRRKSALPLDALLARAHTAVARPRTTARAGQRVRFNATSFSGGILVGVLALQFVGDSDPARLSSSAQTPVASGSAPSIAAVLSSDAVPAATTGDARAESVVVPNARAESVVVPDATRIVETRREVARATARNYRGGLRIDSQPAGAAVFVNNQQVGHTPMVLSSLQAGSRAVRLQLNGYAPWSRAVRVVANQQASVSAQLVPAR
jgi:hypothetical protein